MKHLYRVQVREVHIQGYLVLAGSEEEALEKIIQGEGEIDEADFEYSHTLDHRDHSTLEIEPPTTDSYRHIWAECPKCHEENNYRDGADPEWAICNGCNHSWKFVMDYSCRNCGWQLIPEEVYWYDDVPFCDRECQKAYEKDL